jgi:hypothetical protein
VDASGGLGRAIARVQRQHVRRACLHRSPITPPTPPIAQKRCGGVSSCSSFPKHAGPGSFGRGSREGFSREGCGKGNETGATVQKAQVAARARAAQVTCAAASAVAQLEAATRAACSSDK